jgi:hypothetical protein
MGTEKAREGEIEITPAMIAAGVEAYDEGFGFDGEMLDATTGEFVKAIFHAMWSAKEASDHAPVSLRSVPVDFSADAKPPS